MRRRSPIAVAVSLMFSLGSTAVMAQPKPSASRALTRYDTRAQTEAKKKALAFWCIEEGHSSKESPCSSRKEFALQVLDIIKRVPPHRITYAMYKDLTIDDENGNYLADGWLALESLPLEVSRTSSGDNELVTYRWEGTGGSVVVGTYRNGHLVSKTQLGVRP